MLYFYIHYVIKFSRYNLIPYSNHFESYSVIFSQKHEFTLETCSSHFVSLFSVTCNEVNNEEVLYIALC